MSSGGLTAGFRVQGSGSGVWGLGFGNREGDAAGAFDVGWGGGMMGRTAGCWIADNRYVCFHRGEGHA